MGSAAERQLAQGITGSIINSYYSESYSGIEGYNFFWNDTILQFNAASPVLRSYFAPPRVSLLNFAHGISSRDGVFFAKLI